MGKDLDRSAKVVKKGGWFPSIGALWKMVKAVGVAYLMAGGSGAYAARPEPGEPVVENGVASQQAPLFVRQFKNPSYSGCVADFVSALPIRGGDGFVVAGSVCDSTTGGSSVDASLTRLDRNGEILWNRVIGLTGPTEAAQSVTETSSGDYVTLGYTTALVDSLRRRKPLITSFNANTGERKISKILAIDPDYDFVGSCVTATSDQCFLVTVNKRSSSGILEYGALIKLDQNFDLVWSRTFEGTWSVFSNTYSFNKVLANPDGGCTVIGTVVNQGMIAQLDNNGELKWNSRITTQQGSFSNTHFDAAIRTSDGCTIVAGSVSNIDSALITDATAILVAKFNSTGEQLWRRAFVGSPEQKGYAIRETNDGGFIIAGRIDESMLARGDDIIVVKFTVDGDVSWSRAYGSSKDEGRVYDIQQNSDGAYTAFGSAGSQSFFSYLPTILSIGANGTIGPDDCWGMDIDLTKVELGTEVNPMGLSMQNLTIAAILDAKSLPTSLRSLNHYDVCYYGEDSSAGRQSSSAQPDPHSKGTDSGDGNKDSQTYTSAAQRPSSFLASLASWAIALTGIWKTYTQEQQEPSMALITPDEKSQQASDNKHKAQILFDRAKKSFTDGEYLLAMERLNRARRLDPDLDVKELVQKCKHGLAQQTVTEELALESSREVSAILGDM